VQKGKASMEAKNIPTMMLNIQGHIQNFNRYVLQTKFTNMKIYLHPQQKG